MSNDDEKAKSLALKRYTITIMKKIVGRIYLFVGSGTVIQT